MGVEAIPLRHDAPALALPEVGVDFQPIAHPDLTLLEALAHAIAGLSANLIGQALQLQRRQLAPHLALGHAPELAVLLRALALQPPAFALQGVDDLGAYCAASRESIVMSCSGSSSS